LISGVKVLHVMFKLLIVIICLFSLATCPVIMSPVNGSSECSLETSNVGETCTISCDDGYDVTGDATRTCENSGNWSGNVAACTRGTLRVTSISLHK